MEPSTPGRKRGRPDEPAPASRVFELSPDSEEREEEEMLTQFVGAEDNDVLMSQTDNPRPPAPLASTPPMRPQGSHDGLVQQPLCTQPTSLKKGKSIHDRVHGTIVLDPLLVAVIDTPQFQRLDRIQQLGACNFVYPSAKHSRKEHSIGVSHLAGLLMTHLRVQQPELNITDDDVLCVRLAGLVHDLGHGPFSHMFEHFVKWRGDCDEQAANAMEDGSERERALHRARQLQFWSHEDMSMQLLDLLIDSNGIPLEKYFAAGTGVTTDEHRVLVKELIRGLKPDEPWPLGTGRDPTKRFMFDIVSNSRNGLDVDKLDYLLRDSMACLGSDKIFEISRLFEVTRVITAKDKKGHGPHSQICFEMKVIRDIVEIHNMRAKLHQTVYQHHTANVAELMITDVLKLACDFKFRGDNGEPTTLADAALDPISFAQLTDSIIEPIWLSLDPEMKPARELYARILNRNFYKQIGGAFKICHLPLCPNRKCREPTPVHAKFCFNCGAKCTSREHTGGREDGQTDEEYPGVPLLLHKSAEDFKADILEHVKEDLKEHVYKHSHEVAVHLVIITHGKERTMRDHYGKWWKVYDPLWGVGFYNPKEEGELQDKVHWYKRENMSKLNVPEEDQERTLWLYLKNDVRLETGQALSDVVHAAYDLWRRSNKAVQPSQGGQNTPTHTPGGTVIERSVRQGKLQPAKLTLGPSPVPEGSADAEAADL